MTNRKTRRAMRWQRLYGNPPKDLADIPMRVADRVQRDAAEWSAQMAGMLESLAAPR